VSITTQQSAAGAGEPYRLPYVESEPEPDWLIGEAPAQPVDLAKAAATSAEPTSEPQPGDDDQDQPDAAPSWVAALTARVRERFLADGALADHLARAKAATWAWLTTADLAEEQVAELVLAGRATRHKHRETYLRRELASISSQIVAAKRSETADVQHNDYHRDGDQVAGLKGRRELIETQLREHQHTAEELLLPVTDGELSRARWSRKAGRAALLVGAGGGEFLLPAQDPRLLLLTVPATLVAVWRAGAIGPTVARDGQPIAATAAEGLPEAGSGTDTVEVPADAKWPSPMDAATAEPGGEPTVRLGVLPADPAVPPAGTFPIGQVSSPQWAGECIRRALLKENIPVAELFDVERQPWGWTCKVRISEGTPAAIIKAAPDLETLLDLEAGRFIPTPTRRRAVVDLKVAAEDPFAFVPGPPRRAPRSMSIRDKAVLGYAMDGRPLEMSLYTQQGAIVAGAGGGKSANIRTFAEYLTACRDVVLVALDPSGVGLGPLGPAAALTLTSKEEIEVFLRGMHQVSMRRPEILGKAGMGTEWKPSERWPALVAIGDEWPQVTEASKESGVGIQLTGRKVCAQLLVASQFATQDYMGSAIISNLALQVLGPCRQADVVATFGGGAIDGGWLPNRLTPKQADELNDVGKFYLRGGGYNEPIIWKGNWYDDDTCAELAAERAAAGVTQLDEESLRFGGREFAQLFERRGTAAIAAKRQAAAGDRVLADTVQVLRAVGLDRARTERIAQLLAEHLGGDYSGITGTEVGERLRAAGAGGTVKLGPTDGMANPNGYKLADLTEAYDATL